MIIVAYHKDDQSYCVEERENSLTYDEEQNPNIKAFLEYNLINPEHFEDQLYEHTSHQEIEIRDYIQPSGIVALISGIYQKNPGSNNLEATTGEHTNNLLEVLCQKDIVQILIEPKDDYEVNDYERISFRESGILGVIEDQDGAEYIPLLFKEVKHY